MLIIFIISMQKLFGIYYLKTQVTQFVKLCLPTFGSLRLIVPSNHQILLHVRNNCFGLQMKISQFLKSYKLHISYINYYKINNTKQYLHGPQIIKHVQNKSPKGEVCTLKTSEALVRFSQQQVWSTFTVPPSTMSRLNTLCPCQHNKITFIFCAQHPGLYKLLFLRHVYQVKP